MESSKPAYVNAGITLPNDGNVSVVLPEKIGDEGMSLLRLWLNALLAEIEKQKGGDDDRE